MASGPLQRPENLFRCLRFGLANASSNAEPRICFDHCRTPIDPLRIVRRFFFPSFPCSSRSLCPTLVPDVGPEPIKLAAADLVFLHQHVFYSLDVLSGLLEPIADRFLLVPFHAGETGDPAPFGDQR